MTKIISKINEDINSNQKSISIFYPVTYELLYKLKKMKAFLTVLNQMSIKDMNETKKLLFIIEDQ